MKRIIIYIILFIGFIKIDAQTFYVDVTGIDNAGRNGLAGQEWATIEYAVSRVTSGDTVFINPGTYTINSQIWLGTGISLLSDSATNIVHSNITCGGCFTIMLHSDVGSENTNGNQVIKYITFDGNSQAAQGGISIYNRGNVQVIGNTFQNFQVTGIQFNNYGSTYGLPTNRATGNVFAYNRVINCSQYTTIGYGGLRIGGQQGMLVHHNYMTQLGRSSGTNGYVVKYGGEGYNRGNKYYNNHFEREANDGTPFAFVLELTRDEGTEFYNNTVIGGALDMNFITVGTSSYGLYAHDNYFYNPVLKSGSTNAFILEFNVETVIIERNHIKNYGCPLHFSTRAGYNLSNIRFRYNICENIGIVGSTAGRAIRFTEEDTKESSSNGFYIDNNIFQATTTSGAIPAWGINIPTVTVSSTNNYVRNNIITGFSNGGITANDASYISSLTISDNIVYGNGNNNDPYYVGTPSGYSITNQIKSDPLFVGGSPYDFHLQSSSPGINEGINVSLTTDYAGYSVNDPPEIGAYEYVEAEPPADNTNGTVVHLKHHMRINGAYIKFP